MSTDPKNLGDLRDIHRGKVGVVVGNGESRTQYDLEELKRSEDPWMQSGEVSGGHVVLGCNALYRDYTPHYLGSVDVNMTKEIIGSDWLKRGFSICSQARKPQWMEAGTNLSNLIVFDEIRGWSTGPMMIRSAAVLGCNPIVLMGFDMTWVPKGGEDKINNVYKGTSHYRASDAPPTHTRNWERQLGNIFSTFEDRTFLQIGPRSVPEIRSVSWDELVSMGSKEGASAADPSKTS